MDLQDRGGCTPLIRASFLGNIQLINLFLERGADVNAVDDRAWCALHFAAQEKREDVAQVLVSHGATVDMRDVHGNTPLSTAVFSRAMGIVEFLIASGASLEMQNNHGVSPQGLAETMGLDIPQKK